MQSDSRIRELPLELFDHRYGLGVQLRAGAQDRVVSRREPIDVVAVP